MPDTGWLDAASFATDEIDGAGNPPWVNAANAAASDNSYATVSLGSFAKSEYLIGTDFSASLAAVAKILGIELRIEAKCAAADEGFLLEVTLVESSTTKLGTPNFEAPLLTASDALYTFGSETDLWGLTEPAPADLNDSGFGFAATTLNTSLTTTRVMSIDHMQLKIHFSLQRIIIVD